jgi:hypothetical protein
MGIARITATKTAVVVAMLALVAGAQANAQAWHAGVSNDGSYVYAGTINDSGGMFGQFCFASEGNCYWLVALTQDCRVERTHRSKYTRRRNYAQYDLREQARFRKVPLRICRL